MRVVDPAFGRMSLALGAVANIVSLVPAKDDGFKAIYDDKMGEFTPVSPSGGASYTFGRIQLGTQAQAKSKFYVMSIETNNPSSEQETTVLYASTGVPPATEVNLERSAHEEGMTNNEGMAQRPQNSIPHSLSVFEGQR